MRPIPRLTTAMKLTITPVKAPTAAKVAAAKKLADEENARFGYGPQQGAADADKLDDY